MRAVARRWLGTGSGLLAGLLLASCGGGDGITGSSPTSGGVTPAANVAAVVVNAGPSGTSFNTLFTSVTICVPGSTTQCQTIDNIQVDTGSYGLRILAPLLTLSLPVAKASDGNALVECTQFVDGYSWGPVATADMTISGETAASMPVQVIGSADFPNVPAACAGTGTAEDTVATFGANGIIGIGVFKQDCGTQCATVASTGFYYSCSTSSACNVITVPLASQVLNPVPLFATDNNGTIIVLPTVGPTGAASVSGSLIFGIDTQSNNASGSNTLLSLDSGGYFTTTFNGATLNESFIDSGTNGLFINNGGVTVCTSTDYAGFYCPSGDETLTATVSGLTAADQASGVSATVTFTIANAETLFTTDPTFTAFSTLGGNYSGATPSFDWGLPFFYGRRVYDAIEGSTTSAGTGPYVAF